MTDQERYEIMYDEIVDLKNEIKHKDDLINRQKAEIEKLELLNASLLESCEGYSKACDVYKAEIERLVEHTKKGIDLAKQLPEMLKLAQAEAIKEFAERLKEKGTPVTSGKGFEGVYVMCSNIAIDNLVKGMVGEDNEKV